MATILICGHRSYAARGLKSELESNGHLVLEFSRGEKKRIENTITGAVVEIDKNPLVTETVDVVINFILMPEGGVESNLEYIEALLRFCSNKGVKRLIQISSISAYPNDVNIIKEDSSIELDLRKKGGYGIVKSSVDNRLNEARNSCPFDIIFVRPGYIVAEDNPHPFKGIAKFFGNKIAVLIGNKKSTLPCVLRTTFHQCLSEIITQDSPLPVYLLIEGDDTTKYSYFKTQSDACVIPLPKCVCVLMANIARTFHIISDKTASGIKGVFKVQKFDNSITKKKLYNLK